MADKIPWSTSTEIDQLAFHSIGSDLNSNSLSNVHNIHHSLNLQTVNPSINSTAANVSHSLNMNPSLSSVNRAQVNTVNTVSTCTNNDNTNTNTQPNSLNTGSGINTITLGTTINNSSLAGVTSHDLAVSSAASVTPNFGTAQTDLNNLYTSTSFTNEYNALANQNLINYDYTASNNSVLAAAQVQAQAQAQQTAVNAASATVALNSVSNVADMLSNQPSASVGQNLPMVEGMMNSNLLPSTRLNLADSINFNSQINCLNGFNPDFNKLIYNGGVLPRKYS